MLKEGTYFMKGNHVIAEAALIAGCKFFGAYPITPASPIAERMSYRLFEEGGEFIQMEDEIASMASIIGASCGGAKAMTATSGPGISLMLENIGLAYMMEAPVVIVDVMRGGPSTGMPTLTSQGDINQVRWGSHGDYDVIAYCPSTVQECFDMTIKAFNASEKYRVPAFIMADQILGLMTSNVIVPPLKDIKIIDRETPEDGDESYKPYDSSKLVPPMAIAGHGHHVLMTGLTHDERGYPATNPDGQEKLMTRLKKKIAQNVEDIVELEEFMLDDAEMAVFAYGSEARSVREAIKQAREKGLKVGMLRFMTIWPFPEKQVNEISRKIKKIMVAEVNLGQLVHPIREYSSCEVVALTHPGGALHTPAQVLERILEEMK